MKLLIDDARIDEIRRILEYYPIDGVTTNPTILRRAGRDPYMVLEEIRRLIGPDHELHVQVISRDAEGMIEEARIIRERLGRETYIKIPANRQGIKAMKKLSEDHVHLTATAVYSPLQAYLAMQAGADYVAPYINRIDNLGGDGVDTALEIESMFRQNESKTQVLAASFKNCRQFLSMAEAGIGGATVSVEVLDEMLKNPAVDQAVDAFIADFEELAGPGQTMARYLN